MGTSSIRQLWGEITETERWSTNTHPIKTSHPISIASWLGAHRGGRRATWDPLLHRVPTVHFSPFADSAPADILLPQRGTGIGCWHGSRDSVPSHNALAPLTSFSSLTLLNPLSVQFTPAVYSVGKVCKIIFVDNTWNKSFKTFSSNSLVFFNDYTFY